MQRLYNGLKKNMKCKDCQVEMEKGNFTDKGRWKNLKSIEGDLTRLTNIMGKAFAGGQLVIAYRCPKCRKVELYTEE